MWAGWAQSPAPMWVVPWDRSRRRCSGGGPSPGADVGRGEPPSIMRESALPCAAVLVGADAGRLRPPYFKRARIAGTRGHSSPLGNALLLRVCPFGWSLIVALASSARSLPFCPESAKNARSAVHRAARSRSRVASASRCVAAPLRRRTSVDARNRQRAHKSVRPRFCADATRRRRSAADRAGAAACADAQPRPRVGGAASAAGEARPWVQRRAGVARGRR